MKILQKGLMSNDVVIQLENWNDNYSCSAYGNTVAAYPVSKQSMQGQYTPKLNKTFRLELTFNNEAESRQAFHHLLEGTKRLIDYKQHFKYQQYAQLI